MISAYLLANFGGPRNTQDCQAFLTSLLTDPDVTGGMLPSAIHKYLFTFIAKKRTKKVIPFYEAIGGRSPIYQDTESLAKILSSYLHAPVIPFHRYLEDTHTATIRKLEAFKNLRVLGVPLFPHFTYAVTGSIVRCIHKYLPEANISWIAHFGNHPAFLSCIIDHIRKFLQSHDIPEDNCCLLFSAHGLPVKYIRKGDPYSQQCEHSFLAISQQLHPIETHLCYQSKFGFGKWLSPATQTICATLATSKKYVLIVPFGFTSEHIETLYEIEKEYLPILRQRGYVALRIPTIYNSVHWGETLATIIQNSPHTAYPELIKSS
ncbi:Ferrochelatase [Chlamydia avium]|nr:ferrochelatase [Chlamydia avium]EPP36543.1 ferrochelatase [Chlamydia psittaci 10_743_SC13]EPP38626.1 ferrochelatase [Chlamydia avium]VVT43367.1 Ferrochelatase [Chlamydia avium]